jgi:putative ATPase
MALQLAVSAAQGVELIGMPEGRILLAQATVYVACAPKSNASYLAVDSALKCVEEGPPAEIPVHLRDTSYRGAARFGHGKGYEYPHDFPGHYVKQQYLPVSLAGHQFYRPSEQGFEAEIKRLQDGRRNV